MMHALVVKDKLFYGNVIYRRNWCSFSSSIALRSSRTYHKYSFEYMEVFHTQIFFNFNRNCSGDLLLPLLCVGPDMTMVA